MYGVSAIIIILIIINYYLGKKLYSIPNNKEYFNNVERLDFTKEKHIAPNPRYVVIISILVGIVLGFYITLCSRFSINKWITNVITILINILYLIEITRTIKIKEDKLILSKAFSKKISLYGNQIKGIYIYSFNKKFLKKRAFTTKLVVVTKEEKIYKFTLSSIDNKAVLNMIKDNFGVTNYKMYIAKK